MSIKSTHLPLYEDIKPLIKIWSGKDKGQISKIIGTFKKIRGSYKNQKNWKEPDVWISQLEDISVRNFAADIWNQSKKIVNPRWLEHNRIFIKAYELMKENEHGKLNVTEKGKEFIREQYGDIVRYIDEQEGLIEVLRIIWNNDHKSKKFLLPEWKQHFQSNYNSGSETVTDKSLQYRLRNLRKRNLVVMDKKKFYSLTDEGRKYFIECSAMNYIKLESEDIKIASNIDVHTHAKALSDRFQHFELSKRLVLSVCRGEYQRKFRRELIESRGICMLSGVNVEEVLEACHIIPVKDGGEFSLRNGLLLRSDIHKLFDAGKILIDGKGVVYMDDELKKSKQYRNLPSKVQLPEEICKNFLQKKYEKKRK